MSNRSKRRSGELTKPETIYHFTIKELAKKTYDIEQTLRDEYEQRMTSALKVAVKESVQCMAASFAVVLAEEQKMEHSKIQHVLASVDKNVFKVMNHEEDFTIQDLIDMAKRYGVDVE
jgi:hypothetical protein